MDYSPSTGKHSDISDTGRHFTEHHRIRLLFSIFKCAIMLPLMVSCGEDQDLVNQRNAQHAEILELQSELKSLQMQLRHKPEQVDGEIKTAEEKLQTLETETVSLEKVIAELQSRKQLLESQHAEFREKYPIP